MNLRKRPPAQGFGRMLAHGLGVEEFVQLMGRTELNTNTLNRVENPEDFIDVCLDIGDKAYKYAEKELALGHKETASTFFLNACGVYRVADYGLIEPNEEKLMVYKKVPDSFMRGKELSIYDKVVKVEIPFEHATMPGYLTIPEDAPSDVPVVIVIAGATGYKEENYSLAHRYWERGFATLIFDGPGQGESMLFRGYTYTVDNFEKALKAAIDFIHADERVGDKIALQGISYGGYLASRSACFLNDEIEAIVCRGGCSQTDQLTVPRNHAYLRNFKVKFNESDDEKAKAISSQMNIEPYLHQITVPLLVQHTEQDLVCGVKGAKTIFEKASSVDKEYYEIPGSLHCGDDYDDTVASYAADWVTDRLMK
ncbi:alpha/beta hydrolase family protein [Candidatus Enterococcus mansonii]|uniref:Serine aminopeptidase S33 domain-containing protein n=1 Tax=Candidatus Enterococcus mansonii TaxID=1834181 RepID=A0A242C6F7_9ENTE|nr:alpha/beta fold hydrolase [Enterococcus sp. 4G2_DIV0659]OTO05835.1 hypothetical protein A5880_003010 [Enterococcus sp. 4G2_DIV0659]